MTFCEEMRQASVARVGRIDRRTRDVPSQPQLFYTIVTLDL
jgi:hypothetical protein